MAESGGACLRCRELGATVDHVIPLCLREPNKIENVQVLCASCNSEKEDRVENYRK